MINKDFIQQSNFWELSKSDQLDAIATAIVDRKLCASDVQQLSGRMTAAYHGFPVDSIEFRHNVYFTECYHLANELGTKRLAQQISFSKSFLILVLLFSATSCLTIADVYSRRLSNTNACGHTAVSNQSLSGDYYLLASVFNHKPITAINKETMHIVQQNANERDNNVALTHAVALPIPNNHVDARVTIFDPGGPHLGS
jgi:hypothetical protein